MELAAVCRRSPSGGLILAAIGAVFTIDYVANLLGEDEDWLHGLSIDMFPEDGCLWVYYRVREDGVPAFTLHRRGRRHMNIGDKAQGGRNRGGRGGGFEDQDRHSTLMLTTSLVPCALVPQVIGTRRQSEPVDVPAAAIPIGAARMRVSCAT